MKNDVYFAAEPDSRQFVERFRRRVDSYRRWLTESGREAKMIRSWSAYYGLGVDGRKRTSQVTRAGEQGEIKVLTANIYALLVRQVFRLLTSHKAALKAMAANGDSEAIGQAMVGDALLDYYDRSAQLAEKDLEAVLCGLILGSSYRVYDWATELGDEIGTDPDTGRIITTGDVVSRTLTPYHVCFDSNEDEEKRRWFGYCYTANRWELVAKYGARDEELAEKLKRVAREGFAPLSTSWGLTQSEIVNYGMRDVDDEDTIVVWQFRHVPTSALPNGRIVRFVSADCVLYDSAAALVGDGTQTDDVGYPYPSLLAYEFCPERVIGRSDGHSTHWDTLGLQEMLDVITSTAATNADIGGLLRVWFRNAPPNTHTLGNGLTAWVSPERPEPIDLMRLDDGLMKFGTLLRETMQSLVGLNDVAMGETTSGMPAQLAALLEAKALQYQQSGQSAYYRLIERSRTGLLELLQRFAGSTRPAELLGRSGGWALQEWSNKDIANLRRVEVEPVNPAMKSFAWRMQFGESLFGKGAITVEQYVSIVTTGSLGPSVDPNKAWEGRVAREKEMLSRGIGLPPVDMAATQQQLQQLAAQGVPPEQATSMVQPTFADDGQEHVRPLVTDRHFDEIREYLSVLDSPAARNNPQVVEATLGVIQEKLRLAKTMAPELAIATGQRPVMGGGPSGAPPQLPSGPDVKMPMPPPNPLTGEQAGPPVEGQP